MACTMDARSLLLGTHSQKPSAAAASRNAVPDRTPDGKVSIDSASATSASTLEPTREPTRDERPLVRVNEPPATAAFAGVDPKLDAPIGQPVGSKRPRARTHAKERAGALVGDAVGHHDIHDIRGIHGDTLRFASSRLRVIFSSGYSNDLGSEGFELGKGVNLLPKHSVNSLRAILHEQLARRATPVLLP